MKKQQSNTSKHVKGVKKFCVSGGILYSQRPFFNALYSLLKDAGMQVEIADASKEQTILSDNLQNKFVLTANARFADIGLTAKPKLTKLYLVSEHWSVRYASGVSNRTTRPFLVVDKAEEVNALLMVQDGQLKLKLADAEEHSQEANKQENLAQSPEDGTYYPFADAFNDEQQSQQGDETDQQEQPLSGDANSVKQEDIEKVQVKEEPSQNDKKKNSKKRVVRQKTSKKEKPSI